MRKRNFQLFYMMFFFVVFFSVTAGVAQAEIGVTDNEIIVGGTMDLSGPIAFYGNTMKDGAALYFRYINDQGGIYGRKIKWLVEDDGYQSPRAALAAKKLITKDNVFCLHMCLGSAGVEAMYPLLVQYKVPLFIAGTSDDALAIPPRKYIFLRDTGYLYQGILAVQYIVKDMKETNPKMAILYQDDKVGAQYRDGVRKGCQKFGVKNLLEVSYKKGTVDFSSQVSILKSSGITHVVMFTNVREPALIFKEAQRIQYKAVYFAANQSVYPKILELAGDSVDYTNGFYGMSLLGDENSAGFKLYWDIVKKYQVKNAGDHLHIGAFAAAMALCEVAKRAGKNLTREGFIKAAETLRDYNAGPGLTVPMTFTSERRDGGRTGKMCKATGGKWVPITGWLQLYE